MIDFPKRVGYSKEKEEGQGPTYAQRPQMGPVIEVRRGVYIHQAPSGEGLASGDFHRKPERDARNVLRKQVPVGRDIGLEREQHDHRYQPC